MGSITVEQANDDATLLIVRYPLGWTWQDYADALEQMAQLSGDHVIDMINVYAHGAFMPLQRDHTAAKKPKIHFGITVYVTQDHNISRTLRYFERLLERREGVDYAFAESIEAALRLMTLLRARR